MNYKFRSNTFSKYDMESLGTQNSSNSNYQKGNEVNYTEHSSTAGFPSMSSTMGGQHKFHQMESQFILLACELERVSKAYEECVQELEAARSQLYTNKNTSNECERESMIQQISFLKKKNKMLEQVAKENQDPMSSYDNSFIETKSTLELKNRQQEELISHLEGKLKNILIERDNNLLSSKNLTLELRKLEEENENLKRINRDLANKINFFKQKIQDQERKVVIGGSEKWESEKLILQTKIEEYKSLSEELIIERDILLEEKSKWKNEQSLKPKFIKIENERTQILLQFKEKLIELEALESKALELELQNHRLQDTISSKDQESKLLAEKLAECRRTKEQIMAERLEALSELEEVRAEKELIEEEMNEAAALWSILKDQNQKSQEEMRAKYHELEDRIKRIDSLEKEIQERNSLRSN